MADLRDKALRVFSRSLGISTPSDLDAQFCAESQQQGPVQESLWVSPQQGDTISGSAQG